MQAIQSVIYPTQLPTAPPPTYVRQAYNAYVTAKKCRYIWYVYKLSDPGHLARAAVETLAVPLAERTGSETAKKCAYVAAEGLSLVFNPITWSIGKVCSWAADAASKKIQDGLKIQNPELQDLVQVVANECASVSAQYTAKEVHHIRNVAEHQMKKIELDLKRPEHRKPTHNRASAPGEGLSSVVAEVVEDVVEAVVEQVEQQPPPYDPTPIKKELQKVSEASTHKKYALKAAFITGCTCFVAACFVPVLFLFGSSLFSIALLLKFVIDKDEKAARIHALLALENREQFSELKKVMPGSQAMLDELIATLHTDWR